jgi:hypothetical protein
MAAIQLQHMAVAQLLKLNALLSPAGCSEDESRLSDCTLVARAAAVAV